MPPLLPRVVFTTPQERWQVFYCALITLLDKAYMLADLFVNFFFPFIKYNLIFLKQVSSLCINGYDQWSEFLNTAVP